MFEKIKERYEKYYVTDEQLACYITLGVLTASEADTIRNARKMEVNGNVAGGITPDYLFVLSDGWRVALYAE